MGIFDKFKKGFQKSASAFSSGLKEIIVKKEIDDENLNKIEEFLIQSDVGIEVASEIKEIISTKKVDPNKDLRSEINLILKEYIISLMKPLENNSFFIKKEKLNATLISGVNGVGKTTSIGKIGKLLKTNGNKVMFAASDTFRAAAIEQLENWANKIDVQITKSSQGSDPASVAYKAIEEAINKNSIKVKVWERGAGLTKACGTAACATAFAGILNNLTKNNTDIEFETGKLSIFVDEKNSIHMKGPVSDIKEISIEL